MWVVPDNAKIFLYLEAVDMRKSINTLSILVADVLQCDPSSGHLFLFRNRQGDKLKALRYEANCFTLWYRRLERGRYIFPRDKEGNIEIDIKHFRWILASDKYTYLTRGEPVKYENFC